MSRTNIQKTVRRRQGQLLQAARGNRLASTSLLEGLLWADRSGRPGKPWLIGMFSPAKIHIAHLNLPHLEQLAAAQP